MAKDRRWVWAWTVPAAVIGWLAAGAVFPSTITGCGWEVIESGIVSERVWGNHLLVLTVTTATALAWVVGYSFWARRRDHNRAVDALLCLGFGATAWALPWFGVAYTLDDHWSGGKPFEGIPALGEGPCGLVSNPLGAILVGGGFLAIVAWAVWALVAASRLAPVATTHLDDDSARVSH